MGQNGSVEKLDTYQDHDVVGEDFQAEFAALTPSGASADEGFEATLEHRDHGLDLDTIAVRREVEAGLHQPLVAGAFRRAGW